MDVRIQASTAEIKVSCNPITFIFSLIEKPQLYLAWVLAPITILEASNIRVNGPPVMTNFLAQATSA